MQPQPDNSKLNAEDSVVKLAQALVRVPSVTALSGQDMTPSVTALQILADAAQKTGATIAWLKFDGDHPKWDYPVMNTFTDWTFGTPEKHICYIGHVDVVPPGDVAKWSEDPFSGTIKDGYLYGRGTTDMKGSVAAFLSAMENATADLRAQGNVRVSMIITSDEEWAAVNGTDKVLKWMAAQGMSPDAFIVGEPSSQDTLGSHIKIGRRGSLCGTLNVKGVQGHAAYQGLFENPNRALSLALTILNSHAWKDGNANFPNTNFEPVAIKSGDFNASAVIPGAAEMLWNIRFTPDHTPESLEQWVKDTLASPPEWAKSHPDAASLKNITVIANKDTASKPYYSAPDTLAVSAQDAIADVLGSAAKFDGSGGTTDGRFAAVHFPKAQIIEFGLPERGGMPGGIRPSDYLAKGGMHQVDERLAVDDLVNLRDIFKKTVMNYVQHKPSAASNNNPPARRQP